MWSKMNEISRAFFLKAYMIVGYLLLTTGIIWSLMILIKYIEMGGWAVEPQRRISRYWGRFHSLGLHSIFFIIYGSLYWLFWTMIIFFLEKEHLKSNSFKIGFVGMMMSVSVFVFFFFTEQGKIIFD